MKPLAEILDTEIARIVDAATDAAVAELERRGAPLTKRARYFVLRFGIAQAAMLEVRDARAAHRAMTAGTPCRTSAARAATRIGTVTGGHQFVGLPRRGQSDD